MKHAQYYRNIANGIARINQCIFACKLAPVETGTFYSKRFCRNKITKTSDAEWLRLIKNHLQLINGKENNN